MEEQEDILLSFLPSWGFLAVKLNSKAWEDQEAISLDEASGTYASVW